VVPKKKQACIVDDVRRIIENTPDNVFTKAEEASLWLFALQTGARAITCAEVRIGDLSYLGGVLRVKLRLTKGIKNWDHSV